MGRTQNTGNYWRSAIAVSVPPCSIAARFNLSSLNTRDCINYLFGSTNYYGINFDGTYFQARMRASAALSTAAVSGVAISTSTWYNVVATFASANTRSIYVDGVGVTDSTANSAPTAPTTLDVGGPNDSGVGLIGVVAEVGFWNAALDASEAAAYGKGISPQLIRPASLIGYWPMIGKNSPELPHHGPYSLTVTGTAVVGAHPRVYYRT